MTHSTKYLLVSDVGILQRAQSIFGEGLVLDDYACVPYVEGVPSTKEQALVRLQKVKAEGYDAGDIPFQLDVDAESVVLRMSSNKLVVFTTSEWGAIAGLSREEVEYA